MAEDDKKISILKVTGHDFVDNAEEFLDKISDDDSIGRVTISTFDDVLYLMTQDKFEFFVNYELRRKELLRDREGFQKRRPCEELKEEQRKEEKQKEEEESSKKEEWTPAQQVMIDLKNKLNILPQLTDRELVTVLKDMRIARYGKGDKLYSINHVEEEMYYIIRGRVVTTIGDNIQLLSIGAREFFGEVSTIGAGRRMASATVISEEALIISLIINRDVKKGSEVAFLKLNQALFSILSDKVARLIGKIESK
jgi:CRP-like cAMP-binding protein